jgi:hypothetical protein
MGGQCVQDAEPLSSRLGVSRRYLLWQSVLWQPSASPDEHSTPRRRSSGVKKSPAWPPCPNRPPAREIDISFRTRSAGTCKNGGAATGIL